MTTEKDNDYVKHCATQEADRAYISLEDLLNTLRILNYQNTAKYKTLSEAFVTLSIITRYGIEVFENNTYEREHIREW